MSNEHDPPESELNAIEAALGSLAPSKSRMNRDRLMFEAGRASVRKSSAGRRGWIAVAASFALIASGEGALLARRPAPQVIEKVVVREPAKSTAEPHPELAVIPKPAPPSTSLLLGFGTNDHGRLVGQLLRYGLDGLPASSRSTWGESEPMPASSRRHLQEELRKALDLGDPS